MTDRSRSPRTLLIPDHVWHAYEQMAADMGSERDGLVSQALFAFARMNGYLVPSDLQRLGISAPPPAADHSERAEPSRPDPLPRAAPKPASRPYNPAMAVGPATIQMEPDPSQSARRSAANPERIAELERQLQSAPPPGRAAPTPAANIEVDDALLGDDGAVHATSMELPNLRDLGLAPDRSGPSAISINPNEGARGVEVASQAGGVLVISSDGRELDRVTKERFLIGRGKHCDLIINSGKVSREHAAITREGTDYFIEDLGSSNGTWFDKRRISKRQVQEGDEYFICAEKLSCSFRQNG